VRLQARNLCPGGGVTYATLRVSPPVMTPVGALVAGAAMTAHSESQGKGARVSSGVPTPLAGRLQLPFAITMALLIAAGV
jgi:uncharacterized membrane protein